MSNQHDSNTSVAVVVGVDGSPGSNEALHWALAEARLRKAPLRALHSWKEAQSVTLPPGAGNPPYSSGATESAERHAADEVLTKAIDELGDVDDVIVERVAVEGSPAQALINAVSEQDILVVGSRGHGTLAGMVLGSVSQECAQHAPCPVVIVRATSNADQGTN